MVCGFFDGLTFGLIVPSYRQLILIWYRYINGATSFNKLAIFSFYIRQIVCKVKFAYV